MPSAEGIQQSAKSPYGMVSKISIVTHLPVEHNRRQNMGHILACVDGPLIFPPASR